MPRGGSITEQTNNGTTPLIEADDSDPRIPAATYEACERSNMPTSPDDHVQLLEEKLIHQLPCHGSW